MYCVSIVLHVLRKTGILVCVDIFFVIFKVVSSFFSSFFLLFPLPFRSLWRPAMFSCYGGRAACSILPWSVIIIGKSFLYIYIYLGCSVATIGCICIFFSYCFFVCIQTDGDTTPYQLKKQERQQKKMKNDIPVRLKVIKIAQK